MKQYRIIKEKCYYDGTWFYVENYRTYFFKCFDGWERLQQEGVIPLDLSIHDTNMDFKEDVRFRSKKEAEKYIKLL
tara:strand:+ start:63 stop:290 length:228 start_codon:yes stop_codon:yes gene_type:complete